jgi:serine protease Do
MRGYGEVVARLQRSTVQVVDGHGGGSGVVWDAGGTIVTNAHVARGREAEVIDASGRRLRGRVIKRDGDSDLAVLNVKAPGLEPAEIGDSDSLRTGQIVLAVGNPMGLVGAVAAGMVHSIGPLDLPGARHPTGWRPVRPAGTGRGWIQADVRLAPGNSGGMLADAAGRVIGINTMIFHGIGLAVPSNEVREFVRGESERVKLGVEMVRVREGLVVVAVEAGSLAEGAGVSTGDVILCGPDELARLLVEVKRSGTADVPMMRGGERRNLRLSLRERVGAQAA